jgi:hypothetical protein
VAWLIPYLRISCATGNPASPYCRIATICDSLNFDFFILRLPEQSNPARKVHFDLSTYRGGAYDYNRQRLTLNLARKFGALQCPTILFYSHEAFSIFVTAIRTVSIKYYQILYFSTPEVVGNHISPVSETQHILPLLELVPFAAVLYGVAGSEGAAARICA